MLFNPARTRRLARTTLDLWVGPEGAAVAPGTYAAPFREIQQAWDYAVTRHDLAGFQLRILVKNGEYEKALLRGMVAGQNYFGQVSLLGSCDMFDGTLYTELNPDLCVIRPRQVIDPVPVPGTYNGQIRTNPVDFPNLITNINGDMSLLKPDMQVQSLGGGGTPDPAFGIPPDTFILMIDARQDRTSLTISKNATLTGSVQLQFNARILNAAQPLHIVDHTSIYVGGFRLQGDLCHSGLMGVSRAELALGRIHWGECEENNLNPSVRAMVNFHDDHVVDKGIGPARQAVHDGNSTVLTLQGADALAGIKLEMGVFGGAIQPDTTITGCDLDGVPPLQPKIFISRPTLTAGNPTGILILKYGGTHRAADSGHYCYSGTSDDGFEELVTIVKNGPRMVGAWHTQTRGQMQDVRHLYADQVRTHERREPDGTLRGGTTARYYLTNDVTGSDNAWVDDITGIQVNDFILTSKIPMGARVDSVVASARPGFPNAGIVTWYGGTATRKFGAGIGGNDLHKGTLAHFCGVYQGALSGGNLQNIASGPGLACLNGSSSDHRTTFGGPIENWTLPGSMRRVVGVALQKGAMSMVLPTTFADELKFLWGDYAPGLLGMVITGTRGIEQPQSIPSLADFLPGGEVRLARPISEEVGTSFSAQGQLGAGLAKILAVANVGGSAIDMNIFRRGQAVSGAGIPAGAWVTRVNHGELSLDISDKVTASGNPVVLTINDVLWFGEFVQDGSFLDGPNVPIRAIDSRLKSKTIQILRTLDAANATIPYVGVGFRPSAIIFFGNRAPTNETLFLGMVDQNRAGRALAGAQGSTAQTRHDTAPIFWGDAAGNQSGTVASFDADGFTIAWSKGGASTQTGTFVIYALCLV